MVYTHDLGVVAKEKNKLLGIIIAFVFAIMTALGIFAPIGASAL